MKRQIIEVQDPLQLPLSLSASVGHLPDYDSSACSAGVKERGKERMAIVARTKGGCGYGHGHGHGHRRVRRSAVARGTYEKDPSEEWKC